MSAKNEIFDKTYTEYLARLADLDLLAVAERLDLDQSGQELLLSLLGEQYRVSKKGIVNPKGQQADFAACIVIFKYLLMCPDKIPTEGEWTTYHSFKDAQPLLDYFAREVTGPIERGFSGRLKELREVCESLGGAVSAEAGAYDLSVQFEAISRVPLFLRFNDVDEEFPAQCTILFRKSVEHYLDMESLGVLSALFAQRLLTLDRA